MIKQINLKKRGEGKIFNGVKNKAVNSVIINFPTNLGDAIMGLPVLDRLRFNYPSAKITAIASPKVKNFFLSNSFVDEVIMFDKVWKLWQKVRFVLDLRGKYDLIVDLKNSFLPVVLGAKKRSSFLRNFPKGAHAREEYLSLIDKIAPKKGAMKSEFKLICEDEKKWGALNIEKAVFIACSSRSCLKSYPCEYLKEVIQVLSKRYELVILGTKEDRSMYGDILFMEGVVDLVGETQMSDVFYLLKKYAQGVICVDSSVMHAASYLNLPIVAIFGPTDVNRYGPWPEKSIVLRKENLTCSPCGKAKCDTDSECMRVRPQEVVEAVERMLNR